MEVERWRKYSMTHDVSSVNQSGYSGGDVQVSDIRLRGANGAKLFVFRVRVECLRERGKFNWITQRRTGAVRLNVTDGLGIHSGGFVRQGNHPRLSLDTGRRVTNFRRTVVVRSKTSNHGIDLVAIAHGVFQALQQYDGNTASENGSLRVGAERAAVAVRRNHAAVLIIRAAFLGKGDRTAAGERHIALVGEQRLASLGDGHQRGGAARHHGETGTAKIQFVRNARTQEIGIVPHHLRIAAYLIAAGIFSNEAWTGAQASEEIRALAAACEHADGTRVYGRIVTGIFESLPAGFQEKTLLRIHQFSIARKDTEKFRVEETDVFQNRPGTNVTRILRQFRCIWNFEFIHSKMRNRFDAVELVSPELGYTLGSRKAPGHSDNCDALKERALVIARAHEAPPP